MMVRIRIFRNHPSHGTYIRPVTQKYVRTCGVKSEIWSVQGICLDRQQSQIWHFSDKNYHPSYARNIFWVTIYFEYQGLIKLKIYINLT